MKIMTKMYNSKSIFLIYSYTKKFNFRLLTIFESYLILYKYFPNYAVNYWFLSSFCLILVHHIEQRIMSNDYSQDFY